MNIKEITWQSHNDFGAILKCEHCHHEAEIKTGYHDDRDDYVVIPSMICEECGKNRAGTTDAIDGFGHIGIHNAATEIMRERLRQDEKWGGAAHDDHHTTADFVQLIQDYAGWARTMAGMNSPAKARIRLIQVAALAVAAIETIDRANTIKD
jgi:hypothetical protein